MDAQSLEMGSSERQTTTIDKGYALQRNHIKLEWSKDASEIPAERNTVYSR